MVIGGVFGINAEGKTLEDIPKPSTAVDPSGREAPSGSEES